MRADKYRSSTLTAEELIPLSCVGVGQTVIVREVRSGLAEVEGGDIGLRLLELGFVEGEPLRVIAHGYPGREPIAVRIGSTTFALRRFEADHVLVALAPQKQTEVMSDASQSVLRIALLGNPNCGKTALFNLLTGSRQKVANYAGVTVERKEGLFDTPMGQRVRVLDLPGAYSLNPLSQDETITRDVVLGNKKDEPSPDLLVCVTDATNLRLNLRLVVEVKRLGLPTVLALNMTDVAKHRGVEIDVAALERELGMPVVQTVAVRRGGADALVRLIQEHLADRPMSPREWKAPDVTDVAATQREVRRILDAAVREPLNELRVDDALDRVVMHPVWGFVILAATLFLIFQAVFQWAQLPMDWIKAGVEALGALLTSWLPAGVLQSLLVDGVVAGVGSVLVFLPQILILFMFILALEDSGYLPRAAFMLDRLMGTVGLSGRSFIPLLSSFACAVPGIMATRHISSWRDRLTTIMIAPLTTCSARLPVYALIIGAFIPRRTVLGFLNLQGVVLFVLYLAGIVSAMAVAWVFKVAAGRGTAAPAADGIAFVSLAQPAQPVHRPHRAGEDLPRARRHDHPVAVDPAVVPVFIPGSARRCHRPGHPVQSRGNARAGAGDGAGADRIQLADFDRPHTGACRTRSGGQRARYGVRAIRYRRQRGGPADTDDRAGLVAGDGILAARLVCVRATVHFDAVDREAGNQLDSLSAADGRLPVCACVPGCVRHLPRHACIQWKLSACRR